MPIMQIIILVLINFYFLLYIYFFINLNYMFYISTAIVLFDRCHLTLYFFILNYIDMAML